MPATSQPIPVPAPYGGINTREGVAALQPFEARHLENWTPQGNAVKPRDGQTEYSTGGTVSEPVETLVAFDGIATSVLVGIGGGDVYDFSSTSAVLIDAAGFTNSRFQTENYVNRLIGVNGTDAPWIYDGSTFTTASFSGSGLTLSHLVNIAKVRNRLWFCETDKAAVWYGGLGSISGALTKFQLDQVVAGGYCMAVGAHSQDAGAGPDDYTAFIMSTGEVALYSGDPSSTFSKVGNYKMPPPVGRRCLVNVGGQLVVLTKMGLVPLTAAISGVAFDALAIGPFGKVSPSIKTDVETYGDLAGWEMAFHNGLVITNVPTLDGQASKQWVYNSLTGAYTTWTGIYSASLAVYGGELYSGRWDDGTVVKHTGDTDFGAAIELTAKQAFVSVAQGRLMQATAIRFDMSVSGQLYARFGFDSDYIEDGTVYPSLTLAANYASTPWGSAWGSMWSSSQQTKGQLFSAWGEGRNLALRFSGQATASTLEWYGYQMLARPCGIL